MASGFPKFEQSSPGRGGGGREAPDGGGSPSGAAPEASPLHHPADGPPPRSGEDWGLQNPFLHIPPCGIFHYGSLKTESCSHISALQGAGTSPVPHSPPARQGSPKAEPTACFES